MYTIRILTIVVFLLSTCFVQAQLGLQLQNRKAAQGEMVCMPIKVQAFQDITKLQHTLTWNKTVLSLVGIENLQLEGLTPASFQKTTEEVTLDWESTNIQGKSLTDGSTLYELCFEVIGATGTSTAIKFHSEKILFASKVATGNTALEINTQAGMVAVAPVIITIEDLASCPNESFCLPVTADQFTSILSMQYTIAWNANVMVLDSITSFGLPGLDATSFNTGSANLGLLRLEWDNAVGQGSTVASDAVLYQLCFTAVGMPGDATDLAIINLPTPIQITDINSNGMHIGLSYTPANISLVNPLAISNSQIQNIDCVNPNGGAIQLDLVGGTMPYQFQWTGPSTFSATTKDITGLTAGNYLVTITDSSVPAKTVTSDFEVGGNISAPTVIIADADLITCEHPTIMLDASSSSTGSIFNAEWTTTDGNISAGANSLTPEVNAAGTYTLTITNETNNCSAMASVLVNMNTTLPFADAGEDLELDCSNDMTLTLDGSNSSIGPNITYSWSSWNGNVTSDAGTLFPIVDGVGNYQLVVTDTTNGCIAISNMEVSLNTNYPTAFAGNDTVITCASSTINLNGSTSSVGNNFSYQWETLAGNIVAGATTMTPTVDAAGIYIFEVTNTSTFCATMDTVVVSLDVAAPIADAGTDVVLSCSDLSINLDGAASSTGPNFSYTWTTTNGNFLSGTNTLTPTIDAAGTYQLMVTNLLNACSSVATVEVTAVFDLPTVEIAPASLLSCVTTLVILDATESSTGAEFTYLWTTTNGNILAGATSLFPAVTAAGTYTLEVTNTINGCSETATTTVGIDDQSPVADAGFDGSLACANTTTLLDGTNSSMGTGFTYLWTTTDGNIVDGETSLMPTADALGSYTLTVTSAANGCTASDVVAVLLDTSLEPAMVGMDTSICVDSFLLIGNAPMGTTGFWTSSTGAIIEQADSSSTKVTGLRDGLNEFSYHLSTADCADYSSATIQVTVVSRPTASDDVFELSSAGGTQTIDLIANDGLLLNDWNLNLFSVPSNLTLENLQNGNIALTPQQSGTFNFQYQLCNTVCANLCDTAFVILEISNVDTSVTIPSGITPNGDGLNDLFIVKQIEETPFAFPNNELIIFNRWGTVVYQAKPYENNWDGTDSNGKALPTGTYYYVLRLDFAQGLVYKGDLSILR